MTKAEELLELIQRATRTGCPLPSILTPKNPTTFTDGSTLRRINGEWIASKLHTT